MGKFTFDIPTDLEKQMLALEHSGKDKVIGRILTAGGEKVETEMKRQCSSHKESGSMVKSIRTTKAGKNEKGHFVVTRPTGKEVRKLKNGRTQIVRNMEKLAYLHYGTSRQPALGIVTKVVNRSREAAVRAMQETYNKEVGL